MKKRIELIPAPPGIQPGDYVKLAYQNSSANTPWIDLNVTRQGTGWEMMLVWPCAEPVQDTRNDVNLFADAIALLVPATGQAPMMTMGDESNPVEGVIWRSDRKDLFQISARGLGSVERRAAEPGMKGLGAWERDMWGVKFEIPNWVVLEEQNRLGVAVWQGADAERAGLKSVTPDWVDLA